ncbi:MAG: LysE family translocator [Reyranella sp.]|uniref:LysE family transporter n=1 Tax=Reyranella sp. TaxID=1929291 RepID=UPI0011FF87D3|nr:LysE family transporter [Reyranella sp.]TAJ39498.1 MAG: LysE family translocator [Reyranella sp.]
MDYAVALAGLAVVHLLAVASPGPSTVLVIQTAAVSGRRAGLLAAFAMMLGALVWAAAALFGLQVLFARFEWLYLAFRIAGALYLLYLAYMLLRHAGAPLPEADPSAANPSAVLVGAWQGFLKALLLQLSNPKVMVFMGSIFISLLPAQPPSWMDATVLAIVALNEFTWFALLALLFSGGAARAFYRRTKLWLDRLMGGVLGLLGARLLVSEV